MAKQSVGPDPSDMKQTQSTNHQAFSILPTLPKSPYLSVLCHPYSTFCFFRPFPPSRQRTALYNQPTFLQNKPNSLNTEISATIFTTKLYRKNRPDRARKNKPNQSQFTRNTRYAVRHTNRESVESAKMARNTDLFNTKNRRLETPNPLNHKSLNDFGSALRPTGTPFAHKFAKKPPRHKETIMQKCRNSSCPRLGSMGLRAFVAKKLKRKEFYHG